MSIQAFDAKINELKRDAEAGDAKEQYALGYRYSKGEGIAFDKVETFKWTSAQPRLGTRTRYSSTDFATSMV